MSTETDTVAAVTGPVVTVYDDSLGDDNSKPILQSTRARRVMEALIASTRTSILEKVVAGSKKVPDFTEGEQKLIDYRMPLYAEIKKKAWRQAKIDASTPELQQKYKDENTKRQSESTTRRGVGSAVNHNDICTTVTPKFFKGYKPPSATVPDDVIACMPRRMLAGGSDSTVARVCDRVTVYAIQCAIKSHLANSNKAQIAYARSVDDVGPGALLTTAAEDSRKFHETRNAEIAAEIASGTDPKEVDVAGYKLEFAGSVKKYLNTAICRLRLDEGLSEKDLTRINRPNFTGIFREIIDRSIGLYLSGVAASIDASVEATGCYNVHMDVFMTVLFASVISGDFANREDGVDIVNQSYRFYLEHKKSKKDSKDEDETSETSE